ncbi:MAG: polymerase, sigma-24 subunit, subfamily [Bryobacterales bacterium]|jgi:RNA polymerase sigma-70 factor (ECF subfamily)|nr:polymerase, sigma-24 subunit, subfamily [Bryobacterales bacterium]
MITTDAELLEQALRGIEDAFTALYRRRQGGVYRFALQMTGSTAIAEDVTQEAFLALLLRGARYDQVRGTVASFLYGIARNLVLQRLDRRSSAELEITEECAGPEDLLEDLTRRESIEQVRQAVLSLPPVFREAVVLCDLQGSSYEEAAMALDCPVGTVRSRLSRGRAMLARKLRGVAGCAGRSIECSPKSI